MAALGIDPSHLMKETNLKCVHSRLFMWIAENKKLLRG